ncbi:MAG: ribbon-helix-helix domain-containing protein [Candidatus Diapherotrites archaeon]
MANKMVNLRLGPKLLKEIDSIVSRASYENRSEFIRETLRKEVEERKKERLIRELRAGLGEGKRLGLKDPTPEEFEKIREEVGKEFLKKHGLQ